MFVNISLHTLFLSMLASTTLLLSMLASVYLCRSFTLLSMLLCIEFSDTYKFCSLWNLSTELVACLLVLKRQNAWCIMAVANLEVKKNQPTLKKLSKKGAKKSNKSNADVLLLEQELKFAKVLAGNDKKLRDRVLKNLRKWLGYRSQSSFRKFYL